MDLNLAKDGHVWVCCACGRATEPGGRRGDLADTSCVMHAALVDAATWERAKRKRDHERGY
jgi:hypothetical protein